MGFLTLFCLGALPVERMTLDRRRLRARSLSRHSEIHWEPVVDNPKPLFNEDPLSRAVPDGTVLTRDHAVIQEWATVHDAEPATGEATATGPATIDVNDGGSGIRFNFPGAGLLRPIGWEEWFANFDRNELVFIYQEPLTDPQKTRYRIERLDALQLRFPDLKV